MTLFAFPDGRRIADLRLDDLANDVLFSPDGSLLATVSNSGTIGLWSAGDGSPQTTPEVQGKVTAVRFRGESEVVAACEAEHLVTTWNVKTGETVSRVELPDRRFLYLSRNGRFAFGLSAGSREAGVWDTATGARTATWTFSNGATITSPSHWMSTGGSLIASRNRSGADIQIWDGATGRFVARIDVAPSQLRTVSFSPEGRWFATGCLDSEAKLWDPQTGKLQKVLAGQETSAVTAVVGPGGERILTRSYPNAVTRLWNGRTGESLRVLASDANYIDDAWFSADGDSLLTQNTAHTVVALWDARTAEQIWRLESGPANFNKTALGPDGKFVLTLSSDGTGRIWPVDPAASAERQKPRELTSEEAEMRGVGSDIERIAYCDMWNLRRLYKAIQLAARLNPDDGPHSKVIAGFACDELKSCLAAIRAPQGKTTLAELLRRLAQTTHSSADTSAALRSTLLSIESLLKNQAPLGDIQ